MNIKETFIKLTSKTYPYGDEDMLTCYLPSGYKVDVDGNYYYQVGEGSKNIFACHLDTACKSHTLVNHVFDGNIIKTDGKTILGADDKAGMTIILYMIYKNVPGLYYFFIGEEVGCIGSTAASKHKNFFSNYNMIVSFDRRGTSSIITHQSSRRTCSDRFASSLKKEFARTGLTMNLDDGGVYTDSAEFKDIISECTNISVGYYKEHTTDEHQDISFLERLAKSCVLVNWDSLSISRDPSKCEWKRSWNSSNNWYDSRDERQRDRVRNRRSRGKNYSETSDNYNSTKKSLIFSKDSNDFWEDKSFNRPREYYNDIDNEVFSSELSDSDKIDILYLNDKDQFMGIKNYLIEDTISTSDFMVIKSQFLNPLDDADLDFINYMESIIQIDDVSSGIGYA